MMTLDGTPIPVLFRCILMAASLASPACAARNPQSDHEGERIARAEGGGDQPSASHPSDPGPVGPGDDARRDAVAGLAASSRPEDCQALVPALAERSADLRQRAATALYRNCDPELVARTPGAAAALITSLTENNSSAGAALLAGHFAQPEVRRALAAYANGPKPVKLEAWELPVSPAVAAAVAQARVGEPGAADRLLAVISANGLADQVFLLRVIREIESPAILTALVRHLDDRRPISGGVPSGAVPRLRLADLAVTALTTRLSLDPGIKAGSSRQYSQAEIDAVRAAAARKLAR